MYWIKRQLESIKNLIVWFLIIWKDRQWDHSYYEDLLLHKIKLQKDYFQRRQYFVGWENEVRWMSVCITLLTKLKNSEYWEDEYYNKKPSKRGFGEYYSQPKFQDYIEACCNKEGFVASDLWENKARTLFWKIFTWRYERWWD